MIAKFKKSEYLRKSMSLIDKIRNAGKVLGLVGGLGSLGLSGCAPMTSEEQQRRDERLLMLGLGYSAINDPNPQSAAAKSLTSQILRDYDVAREGKSQVNVGIYNNPAVDSSVSLKEDGKIEWTDKDGISYTIEHKHIDRPFQTVTYTLFGIKIYEKTTYYDTKANED